MSQALVDILDSMREEDGRPMRITSGFRTVPHNAQIGGVPNSAHLRGLAVDIACPDSAYRYKIITMALKRGVTRFEIAPAHVHIDIDPTLPKNVMVHLAKY
jgi:uncharacterized protein YcbK (DUF882 family)